jgi:hypothetical protein
MEAPERPSNVAKWAPLLRAAVGSACWVSLPYSQTAYRSLLRIRRRLLLVDEVAVVGRKLSDPPRIWIGPASLARVLRDGLRGHCGRGE